MESNNLSSNSNGFNLSEEILQQIPTPVMAVNKDMEIIYLNTSGEKVIKKSLEEVKGKKCYNIFNSAHCNTENCCMKKAIEEESSTSARNEIKINGSSVPVEYFVAPLKDDKGNLVGGLEYILDITERVKHEERLKEQARTIREISTPAIKLWEGIVILPVIGVVDSARSQQMMETMLNKIVETSAKVIILDIQGVAAVDTAVANHLIKITKATKLMGCPCIISGVSPAVAQTIVHLGVDMTDIRTNSTLSDALYEAFNLINLEVKQEKK